jgi:very-short-patch-repair endonuclease
MVRSQVRSGALMRLRAGVYVVASAWPSTDVDRHLLAARAEQVALPGSVISHNSAALAWGLPAPVGAPWHALSPSVTRMKAEGFRDRTPGTSRVHGLYLPDHHIVRHPDGYLVTDVVRTAVDVAGGLQQPDLLAVLDAAGRYAATAMVASPRRELAPLVEPCRETPIESMTAAHLWRVGLPMPEFQAAIRTPLGVLYPDCFWREEGLVGEADGAEKYERPGAAVREKEREQVLRDLGYGVVRWLGREIMFQPDVVMARIARELASR